MIIAVHSRQPNYRNTSLIHQQLRVPNVHFTLSGKSRFKKRHPFVTVNFVVTSTHLLSHLAAQLLERNATSVRRKDTLHKCAKNSQPAAVEHEPPMNHDVHTYFGSVELDSVSGTRKKSRSLITVKIVQIKVDTGAEATVIFYKLYQEITNKPLQKISNL